MGDGFLCRRGGGGSNKSWIIVTAPTGSTVTCSNGTVTKTASEKNGVWTFKNCDVGEWIVTVTHPDQAKPATGKVTIAKDGQLTRYYMTLSFFTATLKTTFCPGYKAVCTHEDGTVLESDESGNYTFSLYKGGIWTITTTFPIDISQNVEVSEGGSYAVYLYKLYYNNDECISATGGWLKMDGTKATVAGGLQIKGGTGKAGRIVTTNKIDLTQYHTLKAKIVSASGQTMSFYIGNAPSDTSDNALASARITKDSDEIAVDIASFSSEYYIVFACYNETGSSQITFSEVWLE